MKIKAATKNARERREGGRFSWKDQVGNVMNVIDLDHLITIGLYLLLIETKDLRMERKLVVR
jgi:hypothetical protein